MPVRRRGSLLAGTVALTCLLMAGPGCQSSHTPDHDAFAIPNETGQAASGLLSHFRDPAPMGGNQAPTVGVSAPLPATAQPPAASPLALQPVPPAAGADNSRVIASSWQPVQRVSAEQAATGTEVAGVLPAPMPQGAPQAAPVAGPGSPLRGLSPVYGNAGIRSDDPPDAAAPPAGTTLPPPRTLQPAPVIIYDGGMSGPRGPLASIHPNAPAMPREFEKQSLPPYVVEPPDVLLIQASPSVTLKLQRVEGQHYVGPDGTVNLGIYGKVYVTGMTLEQIGDAVATRLRQFNTEKSVEDIKKEMQVDVLSYNSKYYYVITDGGGYGQQVYPILITGNETVLDAIAKVNGLPAVATKKKIWVARATRAGQPPKVLPVDWRAVTECGSGATNYQIFPGDRVYVQSDCWIRFDSYLAKRLSPLLRGFGATLLGASTVNTIKLGSTGIGVGAVSGLGTGAVIR